MIKLIDFLGLKFEATQYKWGRKLYKGKWYLIENAIVLPFWSDEIIKSCQGKVLKIENYNE